MKTTILLSIILLFTIETFGQPDSLRVCFTGDVMLGRAVEQKVINKGFSYFSNPVNHLLKDYPYRIINLESPITTVADPIAKPYNFRVDTSFFELLKIAGITHTGIANNHINDQKKLGAIETRNGLLEQGIVPFGYNADDDQKCEPIELTQGRTKMAMFAAIQLGLPEQEAMNICSCNHEGFLQQINRYKVKNPETIVVCYLHWGVEYNHSPTESQKELAHKLIDSGVDIVIGHHPHVVQTIEFYKHKPIFYSLGNFIFDQQQPETKEGIVLGIAANENSLEYKIIPFAISDFRPVAMTDAGMIKLKDRILRYSKDISMKTIDGGWMVTEKKDSMDQEVKNYSAEMCDSNFCGIVSLQKLTSLKGYRLSIDDTIANQKDELHLKYPVYRFDLDDIDNDGKTDILLGVIKPTHFEPIDDKRLFIFRIDSFQIRPLWLGSKLCNELVDFRSNHKSHQVISLEKSENGLYCIGIYHWQNFGLRLIGYNDSNLDYKTALTKFENEN